MTDGGASDIVLVSEKGSNRGTAGVDGGTLRVDNDGLGGSNSLARRRGRAAGANGLDQIIKGSGGRKATVRESRGSYTTGDLIVTCGREVGSGAAEDFVGDGRAGRRTR